MTEYYCGSHGLGVIIVRLVRMSDISHDLAKSVTLTLDNRALSKKSYIDLVSGACHRGFKHSNAYRGTGCVV